MLWQQRRYDLVLNNDSKVLVSNIQRFSLQDGPGIRTTIFLMGCSLRCPWCNNPENLSMELQPFFDRNKCVYLKEGRRDRCRYNVECMIPFKSPVLIGECPFGAFRFYGEYYSIDKLFNEIMKDSLFYADDGGITLSGGEAFLQAEQLLPLLRRLKKVKIAVCIETALFVEKELVAILAPYIDLLYIDIKSLEKNICKHILKGELSKFLDNVQYVFQYGIDVVFRIPLIGGVTNTEKNKKMILSFLKRYVPNHVELFRLHTLAESKYDSLGISQQCFEKVSFDELLAFKNEIVSLGINCKILEV